MILGPLFGWAYHEIPGDVAFRVVCEVRAYGTNCRIKFWIGLRALFGAGSTELLSEGEFPGGVQEPPGRRRSVEDSAFARTALGPVVMKVRSDT